jgi:thymidylate kinase
MKNKFIVFEGLDASGKTAIIKELLKNKTDYFAYSKGIGSNTWIGKIARQFPSTFLFMSELIYVSLFLIRRKLKRNTVLQDRYDFSIRSFIPSVNKWYNRIIILTFKKFLCKPDMLIYLYLPLKERMRRLIEEKDNPYHKILLKNPAIVSEREIAYRKLYDSFQRKKIAIDTSVMTLEEEKRIIEKKIKEL